jgi:hypothetical protein
LRELFDRISAAYEVPSNNLIKELADEYNDLSRRHHMFYQNSKNTVIRSHFSEGWIYLW